MRNRFFLAIVTTIVIHGASLAQSQQLNDRSTAIHAPIDYASVNAEIEANIERLGLARASVASASATRDSFDRLIYPVRAAPNADVFRIHHTSNYVDLDPVSPGSLMDYACGARTYDLNSGYDHAGIDIVVTPFRAHAMNQNWAEVIAAAPGTIIARNHLAADRNCGGISASPDANFVTILQDDGITAYYYHMARNSLTDKQVGDRVEAGEFLGRIGSSGLSAEPHLHFELRHPNGSVVDPNAGACGADDTLWRHQPAYSDSVITAIFSHNFTPEYPASFCSPEYPRFRTAFSPGDRVYLGLYVRDRGVGAISALTVLDPEGRDVFSQDFGAATTFSARGDFQTSYLLPADAPEGRWTIRGDYQGDIRERAFYVGPAPEENARLASAVLPGSRSFQAGQTATVFATVLNPSSVTASGCWISPAAPVAGQFEYRETDPATNAVTGRPNAVFDIGPSGSRSFLISITPNVGTAADSLDLNLRYKCDNSDAANIVSGVNSVLLSFGAAAVPDLIAVAVTPSGDGILRIADENSAAAFAMAVSNVGAEGELTLQPEGLGAASTLRLRICETDPAAGTCLDAPAETVTRSFAANETASFAIFGRAQGEAVPFAPARARVRLIAQDTAGVVRGSTSVAVRTN